MEAAPEEIQRNERRVRIFLSAIFVACLTLFLSIIEIDEISDPADEISFAAFNWLFAPPDTPTIENSDAGVILLNEQSLDSLEQSWPPQYRVHANVLEALLPLRPKAVFLDFLLVDARDDPTLIELKAILSVYKKQGIPVLGAAGSPVDFKKPFRAELEGMIEPVAGWSGDEGIASGKYDLMPTHPPVPGMNIPNPRPYPSAALALYRISCKRSAGANCEAITEDQAVERPMWLFWPNYLPAYETIFGKYNKGLAAEGIETGLPFLCEARPYEGAFLVEWALPMLQLIDLNTKQRTCGPQLTLNAHDVIFRSPEESAPFLEEFRERVIFYGFDLQGFQDSVNPPTTKHAIPGVYSHAVAYENLMKDGPNYLSDVSSVTVFGLPKMSSDSFEVLALLLMFGLHWLMLFFIWMGYRRYRKRSDALDEKSEIDQVQSNVAVAEERLSTLNRNGNSNIFVTMFYVVRDDFSKFIRLFSTQNLPLLFWFFVVSMLIFWFLTFLATVEYNALKIAPVNWLTLLGLSTFTFLTSKQAIQAILERKN